MPCRSAGSTLSVPMSRPRYTAVESQLTISPPSRAASAMPSALFPDAVGPSTARKDFIRAPLPEQAHERDDEHDGRQHEKAPLLRAREHLAPAGPFVVEERDGEQHLVVRIFRRQPQ